MRHRPSRASRDCSHLGTVLVHSQGAEAVETRHHWIGFVQTALRQSPPVTNPDEDRRDLPLT